MLTPAQCRAGRALLKWTQRDLAERSAISDTSIRHFENEKTIPHKATLILLRQTLENAGVAFLDENGGGVKLKR